MFFGLLFSAASTPADEPARAAGPDSAERAVLEEVVVTAQRREQDLMQVPLAITALEGKRLAQLGALDLTVLSQLSPNTTLIPAGGTANALAAWIRGVGQGDHIAGFEPGVGLYVDDVYHARPQLGLLDIFEVERIEVLRGPQGTLYGRNTVGGAIRYITRRLDDRPELRTRLRLGNHGMADGILGGSLPLGDGLVIGGAAASLNLDGFGRNLHASSERNYHKQVLAGRFSAEWTPADPWFLRLSADWLADRSDMRRGHRLFTGAYSGAPVLDDVYDNRAGLAVPRADAEAWGWSLLAEWNAATGWLLRGIVASRADETWKPVDLDALPTMDVDVSTLDRNRQLTAEVQALFSDNGWHAVLGAFYIDANALNVRDAVLDLAGQRLGFPAGFSDQLQADVDTESWALFADLTRDFDERWSASLGVRYTQDRRASRILRERLLGGRSDLFGGNAVAFARPGDFEGTDRFEDLSPRLTVQWRPAAEQQGYLSYTEGFKGGGFDPRGLSSFAPDFDGDGRVSPAEVHAFMKFEPERVDALEVGWKATLLDARMNTRLAIFRADYTDVQISGAKPVDANGDGVNEGYVGITTNAAAADMFGLEWEGQALAAADLGRAGARLELSWALGFIDAGFSEYTDDIGEDAAASSSISNTPRWTAAVSVHYALPVRWFDTAGTLSWLTTWSWRDRLAQTVYAFPPFEQGAYALWDAGLVWSADDGRWQAGLMGRNLADQRYKVSGLDITLGLENNITVFYGNPRQYWLDLQYRFGGP